MPTVRPRITRTPTKPLPRTTRVEPTAVRETAAKPVDALIVGATSFAKPSPVRSHTPSVAALFGETTSGSAASVEALTTSTPPLQKAKTAATTTATAATERVPPKTVAATSYTGSPHAAHEVLAMMLAGTSPVGWTPAEAWPTLAAWIEHALPELDDDDRAAVAVLLEPLRQALFDESGQRSYAAEASDLAGRIGSNEVKRVVHAVGPEGHATLLEVEKTEAGFATLRFHDSEGVDNIGTQRGAMHSAPTGSIAIGRKARHTLEMPHVELAKLTEAKLQALLDLRESGTQEDIQAWFAELGRFALPPPAHIPLRAVQKSPSCTVDAPMSYFASGLGHERFERLKSALDRVLLRDGHLHDDDGTPQRLEAQVRAIDIKQEARTSLRMQRAALPAHLQRHDFGALTTPAMSAALRAQGTAFGLYEPVAMSSALALAHADGTQQVVVLERDDDGTATGGVRLMQLEGGGPLSMQSRSAGAAALPAWQRTVPGKAYTSLEALLTALESGEETVLREAPRHAFTDELQALRGTQASAADLVAQFGGRPLGDPLSTTLDDLAALAAVLARCDEPCPPLDAFFATFMKRNADSPTPGTWTPQLARDVVGVLARPSTRHEDTLLLLHRALGSIEFSDARRLALDALAHPGLDVTNDIVAVFRHVLDTGVIERAQGDLSPATESFEMLLSDCANRAEGKFLDAFWQLARDGKEPAATRQVALVAASAEMGSLQDALVDLALIVGTTAEPAALLAKVATMLGLPEDLLTAATGGSTVDAGRAYVCLSSVMRAKDEAKKTALVDKWRAAQQTPAAP